MISINYHFQVQSGTQTPEHDSCEKACSTDKRDQESQQQHSWILFDSPWKHRLLVPADTFAALFDAPHLPAEETNQKKDANEQGSKNVSGGPWVL
jgi:hypothetical protein